MHFQILAGKSCADDHIVNEMLECLSGEVLEYLCDLFRSWLLNLRGEDADSWAFHAVSLRRKKIGTKQLKHFRPIAVLPTLYKSYSRMLTHLIPDKISAISPFQFAFRSSHQAGGGSFHSEIIGGKGYRVEKMFQRLYFGWGHFEGLRHGQTWQHHQVTSEIGYTQNCYGSLGVGDSEHAQ